MKYYGIDFGTTNSSIAVFDHGRVEVLPIETDGTGIVRSVIYVHPSGITKIGQEAIKAYMDDVAKGEPLRLKEKFTGKYIQVPKPMLTGGYRGEMKVPQIILVETGNRGRLLQGLKSILTSSSFQGTEIFGEKYHLEQLLEIFLKELKFRADKQCQEEVKQVVFGRPVRYVGENNPELAMERIRTVARRIGFEKIEFEMEPTGAALGYGQNIHDNKIILVFDFGGGTLDVTLMKFPEGNILATNGVPIGGDLINSLIFKARIGKYFGAQSSFGPNKLPLPVFISQALENWYSISLLKTQSFIDSLENLKFNSSEPETIKALQDLVIFNLGFYLYENIDGAKKQLSDFPDSKIEFFQKTINIKEIISRADFETIICETITQSMKCIESALKTARLTVENIDKVVTTGGSSLIPVFKEMLENIFGREKVIDYDTFGGVATGLAVRAGQIFL